MNQEIYFQNVKDTKVNVGKCSVKHVYFPACLRILTSKKKKKNGAKKEYMGQWQKGARSNDEWMNILPLVTWQQLG